MSEPVRLPLFPLNTVLFPQGRMGLRIFEARYLDMIARCMKADAPFGICLIAEGEEVGAPAIPHKVGTEARIIDWDMSEPGILGLTVRGGRRFHVLEQVEEDYGTITGIVQWFEESPKELISPDHEALLPLLQVVIADAGEKVIAHPWALDDANWVGYRYAEILPIPKIARQRLLELEDADLRLAIIHEYLIEHDLLKD